MTKKTKSGVQKRVKETGTWYRKLIEGKSKADYYRHFIKKVNDLTTEYFGEDESLRVLKGIESHKLQIVGIEAFLFDYNDISDPSLTLYNECKTVDELLVKSIAHFKRRGEMGETDISIQHFFLALSDLITTDEDFTPFYLERAIYSFVTSLITTIDKSPYVFTIIEPKWAAEIGRQLGLNLSKYSYVISILFSTMENLRENTKNCKAFLPAIKVIYPVYEDHRGEQLAYLVSVFRCTDRPVSLERTFKDIENLGEDTPLLRSTIEFWCKKTGYQGNIEAIITELHRLGESSYLKRYPLKNTLSKIFFSGKFSTGYYKKNNIEPVFINKETFEQSLSPYFSEIRINMGNIKRDNLDSIIDIAKTLNLIKGYYAKNKRDINSLTFKITITNVKDLSKNFIAYIQEKLKKIESITNKNFLIEVQYNAETVTKKIPEEMVTHFRIISDIHADYNQKHGYNFNFGDDFIINCGDTAGNAIAESGWLNTYIRHGVTIIGNHFGYSSAYPELDGIENMEKYGNTTHPKNTKNFQVRALFNALSVPELALLSNTCIEYNGIVIIGTCLYTDFKLYGEDHKEECMAYAKKYMNDFRLPTIIEKSDRTLNDKGEWEFRTLKKVDRKVKPFTPLDHTFYFDYSFNFIKEKVQEYKHKPIVIVTHHAPSPYSISEEYEGDLLNAAFASNLNEFIVKNPQIRLWCHGHMHKPCDYILGETRVICCPFGYNNENNFKLPYDYGVRIPVQEIKSKESWKKILAKSIFLGKIMVYNE